MSPTGTAAKPWQPYDPCPCDCGQVGWKLKRNGHVVGCSCRSCIGKRNRAKGQRTEANRHRNLGGQGWTVRDEFPHTYPITVTTEDKTGNQIPASFTKFLGLEWTRHALRQAEKKMPVGNDAFPALYLEPPGGGAWLLVKVHPALSWLDPEGGQA